MKEEDLKNICGQLGPCGIACGTCILGNGTVSETAINTKDYINECGVKDWSPMVPGGSELNWEATEKTLNWLGKYAFCAGCGNGGGPPDCAISLCATGKGIQLCSQCDELDECTKFQWLKEYGETLKQTLSESRGKSREEFLAEALAKQ
ncbi:MAG: DUF3795 domain-containing protein [Candidatus Bathyarchaeota archaeon]|nr:DUF3795 domain-containing protein [Candidatus Bathyarchaeota archaeon]